MNKCPVCAHICNNYICETCGYDMSVNYENFGSLTDIPNRTSSIRTRIEQLNGRLIRCKFCSGTAFTIANGEGTVNCINCGKEFVHPAVLRLKDKCMSMQKLFTDIEDQMELEIERHIEHNKIIEKKLWEAEEQLSWERKLNDHATQSYGGKRQLLNHRYSNVSESYYEDNEHNNMIYPKPQQNPIVQVPTQPIPSFTRQFKRSSLNTVIACNENFAIGLMSDRSICVAGRGKYGEFEARKWKNVRSIAIGDRHVIGLTTDGTLLSAGCISSGQCYVSQWRNVIAIAAGCEFSAGLISNGTVVSTVYQNIRNNVSLWKNITAIAAGDKHIVGLRKDGMVVACGSNQYGQCDVYAWRDVATISTGAYNTYAITHSGQILRTGSERKWEHAIDNWEGIIQIAPGDYHTIGLKQDGTLQCCGSNLARQCEVSHWRDLVFVSAGPQCTIGVQRDGKILVAGSIAYYGEINHWNNIATF